LIEDSHKSGWLLSALDPPLIRQTAEPLLVTPPPDAEQTDLIEAV
jgi:hypothetical protein